MTFKRQAPAKPEPKGPDFRAYIVKDGEKDQPRFWTPVGAAFHHADGKGLTLLLDAIPLTGRIVLRHPSADA